MNIIETDWNWNGSLSSRSRTDYIALHHAECTRCTAAQVDEWHKANGWSGIGYHFFVRKDGSVYRGRPLWAMGAHVQGKNNCSVGICAEGAYMSEVMPEAQKKAIAELLEYLKARYPGAKIVGHKEIGSSDCPGKNFPLEELKKYKNLLDMEDESMTIEEKERIDAIDESLTRLYQIVTDLKTELADSKPMIYNYIDENMPQWAREGVQWCVDKGIIRGTGEGLGLDDKDLKYCTIIMRMAKNLELG